MKHYAETVVVVIVCLFFFVFFWQIGMIENISRESVGVQHLQNKTIPGTTQYSANTVIISNPPSFPFGRNENETQPCFAGRQVRSEMRDRIFHDFPMPEKYRSAFNIIRHPLPLNINHYHLQDNHQKLVRRLIFPINHTPNNRTEPPLMLI